MVPSHFGGVVEPVAQEAIGDRIRAHGPQIGGAVAAVGVAHSRSATGASRTTPDNLRGTVPPFLLATGVVGVRGEQPGAVQRDDGWGDNGEPSRECGAVAQAAACWQRQRGLQGLIVRHQCDSPAHQGIACGGDRSSGDRLDHVARQVRLGLYKPGNAGRHDVPVRAPQVW